MGSCTHFGLARFFSFHLLVWQTNKKASTHFWEEFSWAAVAKRYRHISTKASRTVQMFVKLVSAASKNICYLWIYQYRKIKTTNKWILTLMNAKLVSDACVAISIVSWIFCSIPSASKVSWDVGICLTYRLIRVQVEFAQIVIITMHASWRLFYIFCSTDCTNEAANR